MQQTPSVRAKYYLNQVRRLSLLTTGEDIAPPVIHLESYAGSESITNHTPFLLKGRVEDDQYVASLSINSTPWFIELAEREVPFYFPVDLEEGWKSIEILAKDLLDREAKREVMICLDQQGPVVMISPVEESSKAKVIEIDKNQEIKQRDKVRTR